MRSLWALVAGLVLMGIAGAPVYVLTAAIMVLGPLMLIIIIILRGVERIGGQVRGDKAIGRVPRERKTVRNLTLFSLLSVICLITGLALVYAGGVGQYIGGLMTVLPGIALLYYACYSFGISRFGSLFPKRRRALKVYVEYFKHSRPQLILLLSIVAVMAGAVSGIGWISWAAVLTTVGVAAFFRSPLHTRIGPKADFYMGNKLVLAGQFEEALPYLTSYQERHGDDPHGWQVGAVALISLERGEEALPQINRALELGTTDAALMTRAEICRRLGALDEMIADLEAAREMMWSAACESTYGRALVDAGRIEEAIDVLEGAVDRKGHAFAFLALGDAYRAAGRGELATAAFASALKSGRKELKRDSSQHGFLAYCLAELGEWDAAAQEIEESRRHRERDILALHAAALLAINRRDSAALRSALETMLNARPAVAVTEILDPRVVSALSAAELSALRGRAVRERDSRLERVRRGGFLTDHE